MGLANNETIKLAVDALTGLLETINKIIEVISGENGFIKSLISLGTVYGTLKSGRSIFNGLFEGFKTMVPKEGEASGLSFGEGFQKGFKKSQSKT
jgi:hypothetical protein